MEIAQKPPDFIGAIRGLDKLEIGKSYIKVYSHISGYQLGPMKLTKIEKNDLGTLLLFDSCDDTLPCDKRSYAADCGVIPYNTGWNPTNYLKEVEYE